MASTNWETNRKRRRPPTWDPPKLLLVVGGLNIVVGTLGVVGVVVEGGVWLLDSTIWWQQPEKRKKGCWCQNRRISGRGSRTVRLGGW